MDREIQSKRKPTHWESSFSERWFPTAIVTPVSVLQATENGKTDGRKRHHPFLARLPWKQCQRVMARMGHLNHGSAVDPADRTRTSPGDGALRRVKTRLGRTRATRGHRRPAPTVPPHPATLGCAICSGVSGDRRASSCHKRVYRMPTFWRPSSGLRGATPAYCIVC
jgi:hypothetical protein